ncbi:hypothetical protein [Pseudonocardia sp. TRM90224]|uniref:hypothetical protein n=1 Tax=Pseudonocardia sp. TRM90224 TaxID=2812678 RepID=UPI001E3E6534|nr:hypothetical protein [Pseudonocardia sp. TRM90224]
MNAIAQLLSEIVATGQVPTDEAIAEVVTKGRSVAARREARQRIRNTARRIVNALDSGLPDQAGQLAEDVGEDLAGFTSGGGGNDPRSLAEKVGRPKYSEDRPKQDRSHVAQLQDLLRSRIRVGVTSDDLTTVQLRDDATPAQRAEWADQVKTASRRIANAYQGGQQGLARELTSEYAAKYSDLVAPTGERRDPNEHVDDPRELAALVRRNDLPPDAA